MNVFLLGAGASKGYTNEKLGLSMPLAKEFFNIFHQLDIASNPMVLIGDIVNYVRDNYKVPWTKFDDFNKDIEIVHSEIYEKLFDQLKKGGPNNANLQRILRTHQQLLFLFNSVINEIQNGKISDTHLKLLDYIKDEDKIITFNWDTLIDRALLSKTAWSTKDGYIVEPKMIYKNGWIDNESIKEETVLTPKLIKLHGSTNWLTGYFTRENETLVPNQTLSCDTFYVYESTIDEYPTYKGRYFPNYEDFSYGYYPVNIPDKRIPLSNGHTRARLSLNYDKRIKDKEHPNDSGIESMPIIIPPVKNKDYSMFGSIFTKLWSEAEKALKEAEKIFIIGYSFPVTDIRATELFNKAFFNRVSMPYIYIINPFPEDIEYKFKHELGIDKMHIIVDKEYFSSTYNFDIFI